MSFYMSRSSEDLLWRNEFRYQPLYFITSIIAEVQRENKMNKNTKMV